MDIELYSSSQNGDCQEGPGRDAQEGPGRLLDTNLQEGPATDLQEGLGRDLQEGPGRDLQEGPGRDLQEEPHSLKVECIDGFVSLTDDEFSLLRRFSKLIANMVEDMGPDRIGNFPINYPVEVFTQVLNYCRMHADDMNIEKTDEDINAQRLEFSRNGTIKDDRDSQFADFVGGSIENPRLQFLQSLIMAANYLDIQGLLEVTKQTYARFIKQITKPYKLDDPEAPIAIREFFGLPDDCPTGDK